MWSFFYYEVVKISKILIYGVKKNSIAEEIGLEKGDFLISINSEEIIDILDYKFNIADEVIEVEIEKKSGELEIYEIDKEIDEDLGIIFETELIDKPKSCRNKCIFCFMEQLPKNVRDTLVFKDDDYRLSFFSGNYITMTNMNLNDIKRIIKYRLSPINISVHATNENVRCMMLNNRFAGKINEYIKLLVDNNITVNTQIVLCKGINDGKILEKTIEDLAKYAPILKSICIVPVGLSKNRENLFKLEPLNEQDCKNVINLVDKYRQEFIKKYNSPIVFLADEFYLKANQKFPEFEDYADFGQIEDGIGLISLFEHEFNLLYNKLNNNAKNQVYTVITGEITKDYIIEKARLLENKIEGIKINIVSIRNNFFGEMITVTGLVTGRDIIQQLLELKKQMDLGENLVLPNVMLKSDEDIFLDDTKLSDLVQNLDMNVIVTDNNADTFIKSFYDDLQFKDRVYKFGRDKVQSYENSSKLV